MLWIEASALTQIIKIAVTTITLAPSNAADWIKPGCMILTPAYAGRFLGPLNSNALDRLPIHVFTQQHLDAWLHKRRLQLVSEARPLIVQPDYDTVTVGRPLPSAPHTTEPASEDASELAGTSASATEEGLPLNWGPEGEEGPLLATGDVYQPNARYFEIVCSFHLLPRGGKHSKLTLFIVSPWSRLRIGISTMRQMHMMEVVAKVAQVAAIIQFIDLLRQCHLISRVEVKILLWGIPGESRDHSGYYYIVLQSLWRYFHQKAWYRCTDLLQKASATTPQSAMLKS